MERHRIALVVPALNEAATIGKVVSSAARHGTVVVVDDGSTDDTASIARNAGAIVVSHPSNLGYDEAINSGFERAAELGCEYVVTLDADGQHNPQSVEAFVRALDEGADVVVGIRDHRQRLGETLFALAARARWGIRDPLCGLKAYRICVWRERGFFDSYSSVGTELMIYAATTHKRISQVPVPTSVRADDSPRFGRLFGANVRILRALWKGMTYSPAAG